MTTGRQRTAFNSKERARAGVIVTFVNLDDGSERVEHRSGLHYQVGSRATRRTHSVSQTEVLRRLLEEADLWPGEWRVRTISTPETVLSDLQFRDRDDGIAPQPPEALYLSKVGRIDMWERQIKFKSKAKARDAA